jgi:hypothetical protein
MRLLERSLVDQLPPAERVWYTNAAARLMDVYREGVLDWRRLKCVTIAARSCRGERRGPAGPSIEMAAVSGAHFGGVCLDWDRSRLDFRTLAVHAVDPRGRPLVITKFDEARIMLAIGGRPANHARATFQSRFTVTTETPSTSATSSSWLVTSSALPAN